MIFFSNFKKKVQSVNSEDLKNIEIPEEPVFFKLI